jgi:hypothetical protein
MVSKAAIETNSEKMKHFYRTLLFVIACSHSTLLIGQTPASPPGKLLMRKDPQKVEAKSHLSYPRAKSREEISHRHQSRPGSNGIRIIQQSKKQTPPYRDCFTVESEKRLSEKLPGRLSTEAFERKLSARLARIRRQGDANTVYTIPTIVHVVHNGEPLGSGSNISYEQVMSQFDVLNEDFRKLGAGYNEHPSGADINIEFVPVFVDPQGKPMAEPGVDRVFGYSPYYEYLPIEFELKPNTIWDPERYFNIWVLNFGGSLSNFLGYAQFPSFSGLDGLPDDGAADTDGVVIGYEYFGRTGNVVAPFDKGRTATHEVGHWLGLRHIWGDGDCSVDDFCADTPNADGPNRSCQFRDSCPEEGADMIENYMDYSTDGCMNIFTNDQKLRIRTVLELSPRRNSLIGCQQAPVAVAGTNISDQPRKWFEYSASEEEVVTVSSVGVTETDTKLSIYKDCIALPVNVSDNALGTQQSELSIKLQAGETVKILWENDGMIEPFEWTLSSGPVSVGASCESASTAVEGSNLIPSTVLSTYWFSFSPSSDNSKVLISSEKKFSVYRNNCDQLRPYPTSTGSVTVYDVSSQENIFIAFEADGGNSSWTLATEPLLDGESCADGVIPQTGANIIPYTSPFEYWYSYTIPYDGQIKVKSAGETEPIRMAIFKECDGIAIADLSGTMIESETVMLKEGETVKIVWHADTGIEDFAWIFESSQFANGEICGVARPAEVGVNHTDAAPQWFRFTTTKFTNLKISSVGLTDVNTHVAVKRECDGPLIGDNDNMITGPFYSEQSELVLYGLNAGEEVFILWSEKWSHDGFDWTLEEVDPLPGDNCRTAKQAVQGKNTVNYNPGHAHFGNIYWAKFTVPESGKKITAYCSEPIDMAIYAMVNCEEFSFIDGDQGKSRAFNLPAGTELIFIWDMALITKDFTWSLIVGDIEQGDLCTDPIRAIQGANGSEYTPIWYDYVMSQDGNLKLSFQGDASGIMPFVRVLDGCGDDANIIFQNNHTAFVSGLNEGERVLVYWSVGYPFRGATWLLEEFPRKTGDTCADPLPANYGLNHTEYATQWFVYTPESTGNLKISSRAFTYADTDLYVYDACGGNLLAASNDIFSEEDFILYFQSEAFLENVEAGQPLLIKWAGNYSTEPFHWEITNDAPQPGDSCEDPLQAIEGINNGMKPTPAWFTFTMPRTAPLTLTSLGYVETNTNVEIYDGCNGNLIASNDDYDGDLQSFVTTDELQEGQTVLIRWSNSTASEKYTFDWRLLVGGPESGLVCQVPAEAHIGVNTTPAYVSTFYWYSFTMPEANKKLVIERLEPSQLFYRMVGVTSGCDRALDYAISDDKVEVTGLAAGEQILILWGELRTGERPEFDWRLSVVDPEAGDVCETAEEATAGLYHSAGMPTWHKYTIPFNGNVHLTSVGLNESTVNTYLEVYDGCDGNLIASNDNPEDYSHFLSEVLLENLEAGQTIWIRWSIVLPFQVPFDWKLAVENTDNHAPVLQDVQFQITRPQNGNVVGTLEGLDSDGDLLTYTIVSGNDDEAFALGETSGVLTIADAAKLNGLAAMRELQVSVSDNSAATVVTVSIDIITSIIDDEGNMVKAYPNPVADQLHLDIPSSVRVRESFLVDISGTTVAMNDPNSKVISLSKISQGIYFLNLKTDKGKFILRIAVVK